MKKNYSIPFFKLSPFLSDWSFGAAVSRLRYLPNWVILFFDFCIVFFSGAMTYVLFDAMKLSYISPNHLLFGAGYYLAVNLFFFWIFKTYTGVIRHSTIVDTLRLFYSQFLTFLVVFFTNYALLYFGRGKLVLTTASFFNAILSLFLLFLFRVTVKQLFQYFFDRNSTSSTTITRAVVYGIDLNSIAIVKALTAESPRRFDVLGFVDVKNKSVSKRILNLPILEFKRSLPLTLRLLKADAIIIADHSLSDAESTSIIGSSIDYNFQFYRVPLLSNLNDKKNISNSIKKIELLDLLGRKPILLDTAIISKQLAHKTILVTGAAGSIGSEITRQLLRYNPTRIILFDQSESPLHDLTLEIQSISHSIIVETVIGDVRTLATLEGLFERYAPQLVYHAAAYKHVPLMEANPSQAILTNVLGTKNVADLACRYQVERFVMVSTDKAVNPSSVMGASKRIAELYVQSKHHFGSIAGASCGTKFITTRFGNVLGSNGSVVPLFNKQIKAGGPITITHPDVIRYFMTIPEACQLVLEACCMGVGGEIYIFDMGAPVKIIDLAKKMIRLAGLLPGKDIEIKVIGLRPGEKLYEELLNSAALTLPTHHEKIMIAKELLTGHELLLHRIDELLALSLHGSSECIVQLMKQIVPEYVSLNSVFETPDLLSQ